VVCAVRKTSEGLSQTAAQEPQGTIEAVKERVQQDVLNRFVLSKTPTSDPERLHVHINPDRFHSDQLLTAKKIDVQKLC